MQQTEELVKEMYNILLLICSYFTMPHPSLFSLMVSNGLHCCVMQRWLEKLMISIWIYSIQTYNQMSPELGFNFYLAVATPCSQWKHLKQWANEEKKTPDKFFIKKKLELWELEPLLEWNIFWVEISTSLYRQPWHCVVPEPVQQWDSSHQFTRSQPAALASHWHNKTLKDTVPSPVIKLFKAIFLLSEMATAVSSQDSGKCCNRWKNFIIQAGFPPSPPFWDLLLPQPETRGHSLKPLTDSIISS